jgi:hypothetical protein
MPRLMIVLALSTTVVANAFAQSGATRDARERAVRAVVDSFYDAISRERYDQAASFVMLEPFDDYFQQMARNARAAFPHFVTPEELMASDSTMPRAVAEWQANQAKRFANQNPFSFISSEFAGVTTPDQLIALSPTDALARWLQAMDPREREREAWKRSNCAAMMPFTRFDSLRRPRAAGVAFADDTTAYVVLVDGGQTPPMQIFGMERVIPARARGTVWRLEPRRELLGRTGVAIGMICEKPR